MKKNIAVVGCGHWGKNLVRNFSELGSLRSVSDSDNSLAKSYAEKYGVTCKSFSEILEDPEIKGVVLAVPAPLHSEMSVAVMKSGKHVYVEKPLAMNQEEAIQMIQTSKKNNVHLMVGHLLQYHPIFISLKDMVKSGEIGEIKYIYSNRLSFGKVRSEEDVIWSFAPHDISMILSIMDEMPKHVMTQSATMLQNEIADSSIIHLDFESGQKAHITVSWYHPYKEQKLVVIGDSGMIVFDDTKLWENKLSLYRHETLLNQIPPMLNKAEAEFIEVVQSEPLRNECQHFIDILDGKHKPLTDGAEGLNVLNVLTAATNSRIKNERVKLR